MRFAKNRATMITACPTLDDDILIIKIPQNSYQTQTGQSMLWKHGHDVLLIFKCICAIKQHCHVNYTVLN